METKLSFGAFLGISTAVMAVITFLFGLIPGIVLLIAFVFLTKLYDKTYIEGIKFSLITLIGVVAGLVIRCAGFHSSTWLGLI